MKGLLLKDFYMTLKYCRAYILIVVVFIAASFAAGSRGNLFLVFYPCLLCGQISANLLAYDERSRWLEYSGTLPYTKAQIVSGKYLIGLLVLAFTLAAIGASQAVQLHRDGTFQPGSFALFMAAIFAIAAISSSIPLPFMFRWGVEKGRIAYYCTIGFVCAAGYLGSSFLSGSKTLPVSQGVLIAILCLAGVAVYAVSWLAAIALYRKREAV